MHLLLHEAANALKCGEVVAIPTETVYGLAASLEHPQAINTIYQLKNRPKQKPLTIQIATPEEAKPFVHSFPPGFDNLEKNYWPGPLTLVIPANTQAVPNTIRAGLPTVAFRIPSHPLTLQLLHLTGPLVVPSANLSGQPPAKTAAEVETIFGDALPLLEGDSQITGTPSTILLWKNNTWTTLRQGIFHPQV